MIDKIRQHYNNHFKEDTYLKMLDNIENDFPSSLDFRFAETPVFIPATLKNKMLEACEEIIDVILKRDFLQNTNNSIPNEFKIPHESPFPEMLVFDFGICKNNQGQMFPQLVEMQGFPSIIGFQCKLDELFRSTSLIPENFDSFLNGYLQESYQQLLREIIVGDQDVESVVLLDVFPEKQKTKIDFKYIEKMLGISTVCITALIAEDNKLFYVKEGKKQQIKRIFNRLVFDDLKNNPQASHIDLLRPYEVEWIPHPNWFYRISKFSLPFIKSPFIPDTYFLNQFNTNENLDAFVLKPLFSFAGKGVNLHPQPEDIAGIKDPENWILQKKVDYDAVIETPDGNAKAEVRLFYFWKKEWNRPKAVHNLARLSKGEMIGTRYQSGHNWVGGTIAFFEKENDLT